MPLAEVAAGGLLAKETRQETKNPRRKEEWAAVSGRVGALAPTREGKKAGRTVSSRLVWISLYDSVSTKQKTNWNRGRA